MENYETIKQVLATIGIIVFFLWMFKRQRRGIDQNYDPEEQQLNHAKRQDEPLSTEDKLNYLCKTLDQIRWIGLSIAVMFALTFLIPQCTG